MPRAVAGNTWYFAKVCATDYDLILLKEDAHDVRKMETTRAED